MKVKYFNLTNRFPYHIGKVEIIDIISDFIKLPGVDIVHQINLKTLCTLWPEKIPDYGDAIIAVICKDTKGVSVAAFDRKLRAQLKKLGLSTIDL